MASNQIYILNTQGGGPTNFSVIVVEVLTYTVVSFTSLLHKQLREHNLNSTGLDTAHKLGSSYLRSCGFAFDFSCK